MSWKILKYHLVNYLQQQSIEKTSATNWLLSDVKSGITFQMKYYFEKSSQKQEGSGLCTIKF